MPLKPGRYVPGSPIRLTIAFRDEDGDFVDPETVTFRTHDPSGRVQSYVYGTSPFVGRASPGNYFVDFTPDTYGVWTTRWETAGSNMTFAAEERHNILYSPFYDRRTGGGYGDGPPVSPPSGGDEW